MDYSFREASVVAKAWELCDRMRAVETTECASHLFRFRRRIDKIRLHYIEMATRKRNNKKNKTKGKRKSQKGGSVMDTVLSFFKSNDSKHEHTPSKNLQDSQNTDTPVKQDEEKPKFNGGKKNKKRVKK